MPHVKSDQIRRNPLFLIFILCALTTPAKALNFTNSCENWPLTVSDRDLFEQTVDLVGRHQHAVESHINDARLDGNPDNYSFIDPAMLDDWRDEVDDLQSGAIKIACEYNDMTFNTCAANPDKLGMESEIQPGRIHVCIDNVRQLAINPFGTNPDPLPGSPDGLLAGTIAHELMHIVDGFLVGHNGGTDVSNPDTAAETIGVAMENLVLTPDLRAMIRSVDISCFPPSTWTYRPTHLVRDPWVTPTHGSSPMAMPKRSTTSTATTTPWHWSSTMTIGGRTT